MTIELVTFEELANYLDLTKSESEYPDLDLIKKSVVSALENHTQRLFEGDSRTLVFQTDGLRTQMIPLKAIPVGVVSSVKIDGVATTRYKIKNYGIQLKDFVADKDIEVEYTGGIETIPEDLKRAALLQTVYEYQNKDSIGIQTTTSDGGTVTKPALGLLKEVKHLLQILKHPFTVITMF